MPGCLAAWLNDLGFAEDLLYVGSPARLFISAISAIHRNSTATLPNESEGALIDR